MSRDAYYLHNRMLQGVDTLKQHGKIFFIQALTVYIR